MEHKNTTKFKADN